MTMPDPSLIFLTPGQLADLLATIKGASPLSISTWTEPAMRKTALVDMETEQPLGMAGASLYHSLDPKVRKDIMLKESGWGPLRKLNLINGFTGADYEESVRRQEGREGLTPVFEARPHPWADRVAPALSRHRSTGALYLPIHVQHAYRPTFFYQRSAGFWSPVDRERIAMFLAPDRMAETAARQGVENPVVFRMYRLDHIIALNHKGLRYRVRRDTADRILDPVRASP